MTTINNIWAREILDSRGNPTVEVDTYLEDGSFGRASVPSGASTGAHEAVELRDGDKNRFGGKGTKIAVNHINDEIKPLISGVEASSQEKVDELLIQADGTLNKSRLGANSILAVSLSIAKAAANSVKLPLYKYLGGDQAIILPLPMMNIINGGQHANNEIDIQEFMIVPVSARSISEACQMGSEIYQVLKASLNSLGLSTAVGDEGGFSPDLKSTVQVLDFIMNAIEKANYVAGKDIYLALDCAATEYFDGKKYNLRGENLTLTAEENTEFLAKLVEAYPIISIEDGMSEDDWEGWKLLTDRLGDSCQLVGDDLFVTNEARLAKGLSQSIANSILIKPNQIGTLTETLKTIRMANENSYTCILSHRSGETEDTTIADLSVATNCGQIKTGSVSRTDRICKYNQLMRIEETLGSQAQFFGRKILDRFSSKDS